MDPNLFDPNNHAPEVSPEDDWGDAELTEEEKRTAAALPKRRNDALRRPKMLEPKEETPETLRVVEDPEEEQEEVVQRLELEDERAERRMKSKREKGEEEGGPGPKRMEPSGKMADQPMELAPKPEGEHWGKADGHPVRWLVIGGVVIVMLVLAGMAIHPRVVEKANLGAQSGFEGMEVDEFVVSFDEEEFDMGGDTPQEALAMMQRYADARGVDEILPMIRDRERLEEIVRKEWKPLWPEGGWKVPEAAEWSIRQVENRDFACLAGPLPDFSSFQFYFLREEGELVIDWEASTGRGDRTFEELAKGEGEGSVIRAEVSVGDMYTFALPESEYQCLRLLGPDRETILWGYVKRNGPVEEVLRPWFQPGQITGEAGWEYRVTVRLSGTPSDALPNQWVVGEMLHIDWLTP